MHPSRHEGLRRLDAFVSDGVASYTKTRNFDFGPNRHHNVSMLSPYIRHRLVLESEVIAATLAAHSKSKAAKFVDEVLWRAYFKGWMQQHPSVWASYRASVSELIDTIESDVELQRRYNQAICGETGIDCFDAWVNELVATGYLHNHARMWFASIWIFTLRLPWQMGADFFLRHLLDGDPAANTLSWRWVGGLHTRGKTYLARVSNISSYTEGRFAPSGQLAVKAWPLEENISHSTRELEFAEPGTVGERCGLLLLEDDLSAATMLKEIQPRAIIGLAATRRRSPLPIGIEAYEFATRAVESAVNEAATLFSVPGENHEADDWQPHLVAWIQHHQLDSVALAKPAVGPSQEAFDEARAALKMCKVKIVEFTRDYDRETWPHANRGFFKLKKQGDAIIARLGLGSADHGRHHSTPASAQLDLIESLR